MNYYTLKISKDEALVLFEFFNRFDEKDTLSFEHAAEYLALQKVSAQIDRTTAVPFMPDYQDQLDQARERVAKGFEGDVPGLKDS